MRRAGGREHHQQRSLITYALIATFPTDASGFLLYRLSFIASSTCHCCHRCSGEATLHRRSSKNATALESVSDNRRFSLQLAAINAELRRLEPGTTDPPGTGNGTEGKDELDLLICRVGSLPAGSEVRRAATAEARRLKLIPPQNAEHGVVDPAFLVAFALQSHSFTSLPSTSTTAGSKTLARSDFLANSKSQLDANHYGLEKFERRSMEYLAVVGLCALIAQETEVKQVKAQEVTLERAIDGPRSGASQSDNQKENTCRPSSKQAPPRVPVPVSPQSQSLSRPNASKPPFYYESVITSPFL